MLGVVVGYRRIFIQIESGKTAGAADSFQVGRIGYSEMVEIDVVLGVVDPVVVVDELAGYAAVVLLELAGDGIPLLQGFGPGVFAAAERVVMRPIEKSLV